MKVVILHDEVRADARPDELDTLVQADCVAQALGELGHESERLGLTLNLERAARELRDRKPDCVFNLVESVGGQGRLIYLAPALLDSLQIPYTGAGTEAMFVTSSKTLTKQILASSGIPTPPWFTPEMLQGRTEPAAGRYIIKSVWEEASVGLEDDSVREFGSAAELAAELAARRDRLGGSTFAECFIDGREFNLSLLAADGGTASVGVQVLPPAEIQFIDFAEGKPRIVGYSAKWREDTHEYHHTPRTFDSSDADRPLLAELIEIAQRCWQVLSLRGYARVDFRVDGENRPWVLEVNANPCIAPDAGFTAAAERAGLTFAQLVERLVVDALRNKNDVSDPAGV
ncbi:MAG TPA: D-alanine--D-alanine ligase [Phycisphaerae bacterium]|nr:D-alanine--D-alanine ligase [Phycisphaerae bacterium]HQA00652.1 D-alanine--D-alanine ligase [Phycisphaerae bacterium]HQE26152.1 D-alanine--D-alanine ligase [Phycisphaerae bacterium]